MNDLSFELSANNVYVRVHVYYVICPGPARGSGGPEAKYLQNYSI